MEKNVWSSSDHNYQFWQTKARTLKFKAMDGLQPPERVILEQLANEVRGRRILDVGVGAGRTTKGFLSLSDNYVGLDYSPLMVEICRERFPSIKFVVGDARSMPEFSSESFDLVCFAYNGIDCVSWEDRALIIDEVRRVLKKGGIFVHSSHNLNYRRLDEIRNPWRLGYLFRGDSNVVASIGKYGTGIVSHLRLKAREQFGDGWAVLNEQTNCFREMMVYISPKAQVEQLQENGFGHIEMFGNEGQEISVDAVDDAWVYYVSRLI